MNRTTQIKAKEALTKIGVGILVIVLIGFGGWCFKQWVMIEAEQAAEEAARNSWADEYQYWKDHRNDNVPQYIDQNQPNTVDTSLMTFYASMKQQNPDYVGWLEIPGTSLSTPIVQGEGGSNINYYLNHNFSRDYSNWGCPYIRFPNSSTTDDMIIYGHHIRNGQVFSVLDNYKDQDWKDEHETILFTTGTEVRVYKVFCVFTNSADNKPFPWHSYTNFTTDSFSEFMSGCNGASIVSSSLDPVFGDKIMTLVTCEYTHSNGRLVVIAVQTDSLTTAPEISEIYATTHTDDSADTN